MNTSEKCIKYRVKGIDGNKNSFIQNAWQDILSC